MDCLNEGSHPSSEPVPPVNFRYLRPVQLLPLVASPGSVDPSLPSALGGRCEVAVLPSHRTRQPSYTAEVCCLGPVYSAQSTPLRPPERIRTLPDHRCPSQVPLLQSPHVALHKQSALSGRI
ncbi:conserved hypothetical protein [Trichinella spiralis]|uniref:hypothetical protein n=1 Tax=Trichinella spiralis TaxID=6334 RepID=UPI0001EFCD63|nr:conserved hypothetical protein [Trichinella spiralis]